MEIQTKKDALKAAKQQITLGQYTQAFDNCCAIAEPGDDFTLQAKYGSLIKSITEHLDLKKIRVAVLASSTATHFNDVLRFWLAREGFLAEIYEAEYSTIHQSILDPESQLYTFKPDVVYLFTNYRDVKCELPAGSTPEQAQETLQRAVDDTVSLWKHLQQKSHCHIIQNNADLPYYRVFGNYEASFSSGHIHLLRQFNLKLVQSLKQGVSIFDLDFLASVYGRGKWHEGRFWYHSKHPFALDATGLVAYELAKTIGALKGSAKKCLVLDLDNTLWGGVIGDDGLDGIELGNGAAGEAFVDFQKYVLKLKERGIILAVCSKNEDATAREVFLKHTDMVLKLEDIVIFKANWKDKASNIKEIAEELNIGLDSIVFVDDNPVERELVKSLLPMVSVPKMPLDVSDYINAITSQCNFETVSFSDEDRERSSLYRSNVVRNEFQNQFSDLSSYLRGLEMEMEVDYFDEFHLPRIAQLINKSNQFHLTTTRYSEAEIGAIQASKNKMGLYFKLKERFGDNGLISAVILEKRDDLSMYIDTWVMSCRVLSRGVEEFICAEIFELASVQGCKSVVGQYIPTPKNKLVAELYKRLNFKKFKENQGNTFWERDLNTEVSGHVSHIKKLMTTKSDTRI